MDPRDLARLADQVLGKIDGVVGVGIRDNVVVVYLERPDVFVPNTFAGHAVKTEVLGKAIAHGEDELE